MIRVSFSGLDGTGKSTQIAKLFAILNSMHKNLEIFHLFSKEQTVMAKLHETGLGKPMLRFIRQTKNSSIGLLLKFSTRVTNVMIDAILTTTRNNRLNSDIIIYDRYFYDVLLCIAFDFPEMKRFLFSLMRLMPRPEIIIILDADPNVVIERKPEHTLKSASTYRKLYLDLSATLGVKPICATNSVEHIFSQILDRYYKYNEQL